MKFNYDRKSLFIKGKWCGFMLIYGYWISNGRADCRAPNLGELMFSEHDGILYFFDGVKWGDLHEI